MNDLKEFRRELGISSNLLAPLISIADPSVTELLTFSNPDFFIVDMEHSVIDISVLQQIIVSARPYPVIARIRGAEKNEIKKVLDTGAAGIIVPGIESSEEVRQVISYSRVPPEGIRGIGPGRASGYGAVFKSYASNANDSVVIVQIETEKAFLNVEEIFNVKGLDGYFIGPVDLSAALNIDFSWENRKFVEIIDKVISASAGKKLINGIYSPLSNKYFDQILMRKFNFIMLGTDREAMLSRYTDTIKMIREMNH